ncbi:tRNA dihydrouridine synthase DusB [Patescibacteria group bacterium]|nr:MAG: tRNA dihydrouridine synthase DusB [Patescibacteria group bacterium]
MPFSWKTEPRPIVALSPMADMTDSPFCLLAKRYGARLVFREMVSADAVVRGNAKTLTMAAFDQAERPVIQQIFGSEPSVVAEAARVIEAQYHPDGFDLNMGCPVYKLTANFHGAALMREPARAAAIVRALRAAVAAPLSVKTRLGWSQPTDCLTFAPLLEEAGADLITVHGRTKAQGYSGSADWEMIGRVKKAVSIPLLANGDIRSPESASRALQVSGADGVMVARGALGNPWVFRQIEEYLSGGRVLTEIDYNERKQATLEHLALMESRYGERGATLLRKHLVWYWKGVPGAAVLRAELVRIGSRAALEAAYLRFETGASSES